MPAFVDRKGQIFGKLTVLESAPGKCTCRCDCGNEVVVRVSNLTSGNTQSCGCLQRHRASETNKTHGMTDSPEYRIWLGIMSRCYNPNRVSHRAYGGRGVIVAERWHDFANFFADMGARPSPEHTIDRYPDPTGNYEPANCRWATMKDQGNNRTNNVLLTKDGRTQTATQWEDELGLCRGLIHARLKLGWSVDRALSGPVKKRGVRNK